MRRCRGEREKNDERGAATAYCRWNRPGTAWNDLRSLVRGLFGASGTRRDWEVLDGELYSGGKTGWRGNWDGSAGVQRVEIHVRPPRGCAWALDWAGDGLSGVGNWSRAGRFQ